VKAGDKYCWKCGEKQDDISENREKTGNNATSNHKAKIVDILRRKSEKILTDLNKRVKFSYKDAMKYFIDHKGDNGAIVKGAMVLETIKSGYQIYEVFLDRNNELVEDKSGCPLGFKQKIDSLDDELSDLFKNTNVVIVE
jgi:hypothetical protein